MEYLKLFENHSQYADFIETEDFVKPNVSHCIQENEVHYNPIIQPLIVVYTGMDTTQLFTVDYNSSCYPYFSKIEIDGVEIDPETDLIRNERYYNISYSYIFDTDGEHTVKYILVDPTTICAGAFQSCNKITSVTIPNSVKDIGFFAFCGCTQLDQDSKNVITGINPEAWASNCSLK